MKKYALGIDFGTLSARALIVDLESGNPVSSAVYEYPHGVMDRTLPSGKRLPNDCALQHPADYKEALASSVKAAIEEAGISADEIAGVGLDFTASTVMPVRKDGTPLCFEDKYADEPHAYVKLWKHHCASEYADRIVEAATARNEDFMKYYSGKISSEWLFPKLWEILDKCPKLYNDMDKFIEAGDWIVWLLTGKEARNACAAGYKAMWNKNTGYPSKDFLRSLDKRLENAVSEKLCDEIYPTGSVAGYVTEEAARLTGLAKGTPVAVCVIDAHAAFPASGITSPGKMMMIMGTSGCHLTVADDEIPSPGICGIVKDGLISGYYAYEAGQCCFGDHFEWAVKNCMTKEYMDEAKERGISAYQLLTEKASQSKPGENGLIALDWWGGCRSDLMDSELSGAIFGMTLATCPEDIFRALIEANAFGTRLIIEMFEKAKVHTTEIRAAGGIAKKNPFLMQIFADVTGLPISVMESDQAGALGSAMFGAVAGGYFKNLSEASAVMVKPPVKTYMPIAENTAVYNILYEEYIKLHDTLSKKDSVIKKLRQLKKQS